MPEIQIRSFFSGKRQADPPSWNTGPCQTRSRCRWLVYPARPAYAAGYFFRSRIFRQWRQILPVESGYSHDWRLWPDFPPSHKICKADSFLISRPLQWPPFLIYQHCIKGTFHFTFKKRAEVLQIWKTSAHHLYESPFSGSWIKKVLPFLTLPEATVIVPPCCSIICLDRYRPMPVPLFSRTSGAVPL
mgnify:CR=1 FL=1